MASRDCSRQWRALARAGRLRGRCLRFVAAAALFCLVLSGCCLAALLPLAMLLGAVATVLIPSVLRCLQLEHVPGALQPKMLLGHFVRVTPYYCTTFENDDDIAVPCLYHIFPECVARVPVSFGGLGVRLCSRKVVSMFATVRNRPQPFATVRNRLRERRKALHSGKCAWSDPESV